MGCLMRRSIISLILLLTILTTQALSTSYLEKVNEELNQRGINNPLIEKVATDSYTINEDGVIYLETYQKTLD